MSGRKFQIVKAPKCCGSAVDLDGIYVSAGIALEETYCFSCGFETTELVVIVNEEICVPLDLIKWLPDDSDTAELDEALEVTA